MTECRLLVDPPSPGPWNMAVDEVLLDWSAEQGECAWRFYQWSEPTLSLGYFQPYADRRRHEASRPAAVVRRLTGGGAIIHDVELTYSLTVPAGHPLAAGRDRLYEQVHGSLIELLGRLGVRASLCGQPRVPADGREPFVCFMRRAAGDVVADGVKIAGSAQRRRRGAVLQHGSVLLARSGDAPELAGLAEVTGRVISADELADAWLPLLEKTLGLRLRREPLTPAQRDRATRLVTDRYANPAWTEHRRR